MHGVAMLTSNTTPTNNFETVFPGILKKTGGENWSFTCEKAKSERKYCYIHIAFVVRGQRNDM